MATVGFCVFPWLNGTIDYIQHVVTLDAIPGVLMYPNRAFGLTRIVCAISACVQFLGVRTTVEAEDLSCSQVSTFSSSGDLVLKDRAVFWGDVRSLSALRMGYDSKIYSHVEVTGSLAMQDRSVISDWAYVGGGVEASPYAILEKGATAQQPRSCDVSLSSPVWQISEDFLLDTLRPGSWRQLIVPNGATRYVLPGNYQFDEIDIQNDAKLVFLSEEETKIDIRTRIQIGDRVKVLGSEDVILAKNIRWNYFGSGEVRIGYDVKFNGFLSAPNGDLVLSDRVLMYGGFSVHSVEVGHDANLYAVGLPPSVGTVPTNGDEDGPVENPIGEPEDWNPFIPQGDEPGNVPNSAGQELASTGTYAGRVIAGRVGTNEVIQQAAIPNAGIQSMDFAPGRMGLLGATASPLKGSALSVGYPTMMESNIGAFGISPIPHSSTIGGGEWVSGVNTLTGRYSKTIPLLSVSSLVGLQYPVALQYLTPHPANFKRNVSEIPTGPVGYGWSLDFPNVTVYNGGTADFSDDVYYLNLGVWGGGQLASDGNGGFYLSTNPNCKVSVLGIRSRGIITRWIVSLPDSTKLVFGGDQNAIRFGLQNGLRVGSPGGVWQEKDGTATSPYRWDLYKITRRGSEGVIKFGWHKGQTKVSGGSTPFDGESWPLCITSIGADGHTLDSVAFYWGRKGVDEVFAPKFRIRSSPDPRLTADTYYLDSLALFSEGRVVQSLGMRYSIARKNIDGFDLARRVLSGIEYRFGQGDPLRDMWSMVYDTSTTGWLQGIVSPSWVKDSLSFQRLPLQRANPSEKSFVHQSDFRPSVWTRVIINRNFDFNCFTPNISFNGCKSVQSIERRITDVTPMCVGNLCYVISRISDFPVGNATYTSTNEDPVPVDPLLQGQYLEVYQNVGSGVRKVFQHLFDGNAEVSPGNGFFVAHSPDNRTVSVFDWDGSSFVETNPFQGDQRPEFKPVEVKIGSSDYFLVKSAKPRSREIIPVMRNSRGEWISLNRDPRSCEIDAHKNSKGVAFSFSDQNVLLDGCIEFAEGVRDHEVLVSAQQGFFALVHKDNGVHFVFNRKGGTFVNFTDKMTNRDGNTNPPMRAYEPWDAEWYVYNLISGSDYFLTSFIGSYNSEGTRASVANTVWRWNGEGWMDSRVNTDEFNPEYQRTALAQSLPDGFAITKFTGGIARYRIKSEGEFIREAESIVFGSGDYQSLHIPRLTASEHFTSVSYYARPEDGALSRDYPEFEGDAASGKYLSCFFWGAENKTSRLRDPGKAPWGLFDIEISPREDWLIGKSAYKNGNRNFPCTTPINEANGSCTIDFYLVPISEQGQSDQDSRGIAPPEKWVRLTDVVMYGPRSYAPKMYAGGGMSVLAYEDQGGSINVRFAPMTSSGPQWNDVLMQDSVDGVVVSELTTSSLYKRESSDREVKKNIAFHFGTGDTLTYNGLNQTPESRRTVIFHTNGEGDTLSKEIHSYWTQRSSASLADWVPDSAFKVGRLVSDSSFGSDGRLGVQFPSFNSIRRPEWGGAFVIIQDTSHKTVLVDHFGSKQTMEMMSGRYDQFSMKPQVQLSLLPDNDAISDASNPEYRHSASIQLFNTKGMPIESRTVQYLRREDAKNLLNNSVSPSLIDRVNSDIASGNAIALSGQRAIYKPNLLDLHFNQVWGYHSPDVGLADFSNGIVVGPEGYSDVASWVKMDSIGIYSSRGIPLQRVNVTSPSLPISTMSVIEGRRAQRTATISPAWPDNVAVLTAEDGAPGLNENTWEGGPNRGKWIIHSGVTYDPTISHLGRFSMKVVDSYGPTINLYLRDRPDMTEGIEISAWVLTSGTALQLNSQLRFSSDGPVEAGWSTATPEDGVLRPNTWQRWVLRISRDQLAGAGAFNDDETGTAEFRVFCGPGPDGPEGKTIWLDNFVVRPSKSSLSLVSYDNLGRAIGSMNEQGHWTKTEYDTRGNVQAVRDEQGRIVRQGSTLSAGDN